MSWRDQLRPASFRGAAFHVDTADAAVGRRVHLHEYPGRDEPYAQDMGRRAGEHSITAYVIGDDYMAARDALLDAVEQPGPGTLVHPYLGEKTVVAMSCRLLETRSEGRMARFELSFIEAGGNRFPSAATDTAAHVAETANVALGTLRGGFESVFKTDDLPQFVADDAATLVRDIAGKMKSAAALANGDPLKSAEAARDIILFRAGADGLVRDGGSLARDLVGLMGKIARLTGDGKSDMAGLASLTRFGNDFTSPSSTSSTTPARRAQAINQTALAGLTRHTALAETARAASLRNFDSYNEAAAVRRDLADRLETEITLAGDAGDDAAHGALSDIMTAMVTDITARGGDLARIVERRLDRTGPVLPLAYELYDDAGRDADIIARNSAVRHPGFVPGGTALEVLSA